MRRSPIVREQRALRIRPRASVKLRLKEMRTQKCRAGGRGARPTQGIQAKTQIVLSQRPVSCDLLFALSQMPPARLNFFPYDFTFSVNLVGTPDGQVALKGAL